MSITPVDILQYGTDNGEWFIYKTGASAAGKYIYITFTSLPESAWAAFTNALLATYDEIYIEGDRDAVYAAAGFTRVETVPAEIQHFGDSLTQSPDTHWYLKCAAH